MAGVVRTDGIDGDGERERETNHGDRDTTVAVEKSGQREEECTMKEMM
jgi:hypothetical protein